MAQLGYVVIASWKNTSGGSPHFVTVVPKDYVTPCPSPENLMVAHVGGGENGERTLVPAFKRATIKNICFYCNMKQQFILQEGGEYAP